MAIAKRVFLFLLVNILVITTVSITWSVLSTFFGLGGTGYNTLVLFCLVFGMGGAFVSLLLSKWTAKMAMGVQVIDPSTSDPRLAELVRTVHTLAANAGIRKMPEVGIYQGDEINAFATGPSKNNSLVAVSTGLLNRMNRDQVEGVLGHEVAHIANGDMVTMTLLQGVINSLVLLLARLLASVIASAVEERSRPMVQFFAVMVLQIALSILGAIVVNAFSRWREFRADAGGARLAGRQRMVSALRALAQNHSLAPMEQGEEAAAVATLKISGGGSRSALAVLFSTHPPLEERIRRLEMLQV